MHPVLKRNFEIFSACDWLAALTAHIPNAGEHLVRYYGGYSNVKRGKRRKTQAEDRLSVSTGTIEACSEVSDGAVTSDLHPRDRRRPPSVGPVVRCAFPCSA